LAFVSSGIRTNALISIVYKIVNQSVYAAVGN